MSRFRIGAACATRLAEIVSTKMAFREIGGITGWLLVVLSGMLANSKHSAMMGGGDPGAVS